MNKIKRQVQSGFTVVELFGALIFMGIAITVVGVAIHFVRKFW